MDVETYAVFVSRVSMIPQISGSRQRTHVVVLVGLFERESYLSQRAELAKLKGAVIGVIAKMGKP